MQKKRAILAKSGLKRVALLCCGLIFKTSIICIVFLVTSLYVPSGLHTGTKTCGKSFLACCSVYFFSATHLDVSVEHHKSPESLHITETHDSTRSSTIFLCCTTMKPTYLKSQTMLNLTDDEEWKKNAGREAGETIQDISEAADTCVAGNRTNTPNLIRKKSGKPAQCLVVKPLLSEAACAAPVEHSSHPRKGLMHRENLTRP